jgi:predicted metal-dependent enzyme (double-stranded beta helix superfamily)
MEKLLQVPNLLDGKLEIPETGTAVVSLHHDDQYGHPAPGFWLMCNAQTKTGATVGVHPHDHGAAWVVYGVYSGAIQQTTWRWAFHEPDRTVPHLDEAGQWIQKPGEVAFFMPGAIHAQKNVFDGPSVVIRLEGQKLTGVVRHSYDLETESATVVA